MDSPDPAESKVTKVNVVSLERLDKKEKEELTLSRVTWEKREIGVPLDPRVHQVLKDLRVEREGNNQKAKF